MILDSITLPAQHVVLEVEELKAGEEVLDESADADGEVNIAHGDGVHGETAELVCQVRQGEDVLLNSDVKGIAVLEVDRHYVDQYCNHVRAEL